MYGEAVKILIILLVFTQKRLPDIFQKALLIFYG